MILNGAVVGTANLVVDAIVLTINGVTVVIGAAKGQSYTFMVADAAGGPQAVGSDTGPVVAAATAVSNGWFGTATAAGFAFAAPPPPVVAPILAPAVLTTGAASATCIAGRGTTLPAVVTSPAAILVHLGAVLFDPKGDGTIGATLRAVGRFADASEREFWRARLTFERDAAGNARVAVSDPLNLLDAARFSTFTLRDGSQGGRLTPPGGIDLTIPLDPALLAGAPPGPVELRVETQADATVSTASLDKRTQKRFTDGLGKLAALADKGQVSEASAWVRGAMKALKPATDLTSVGVASHLLRQGRAAALDAGRFDVARGINRLLRETTGVAVSLRDLVSARVFSDGRVSGLTPTSLEIAGDDTRTTADVDVEVDVNGRRADVVAFDLQPSVTDGSSQGTLAWAFGTRRREDAACASCPSDLGLAAGQNLIAVTVTDRVSHKTIGATAAVVVVGSPASSTASSAGAPPESSPTAGRTRAARSPAARGGRRTRS